MLCVWRSEMHKQLCWACAKAQDQPYDKYVDQHSQYASCLANNSSRCKAAQCTAASEAAARGRYGLAHVARVHQLPQAARRAAGGGAACVESVGTGTTNVILRQRFSASLRQQSLVIVVVMCNHVMCRGTSVFQVSQPSFTSSESYLLTLVCARSFHSNKEGHQRY